MAMQPGVYLNMPEEEYHNDPAISSSGIKLLLKSPAKFQEETCYNPNPVDEEEGDTAAKKFGRAYHKLIREPDTFDEAFTVKQGVKASKVEGVLGEGEYKKLLRMRNRLAETPKHLALLVGGLPEVSICFEYEHLGKKYLCRVRFDTFAPHWVSDLKTSRDISDRGLFYTFGQYGYDISGAMYSIAAQALKKMIAAGYKMPKEFDQEFIDKFMAHNEQMFAFVFQESAAPFLTRCWCMTPWITDIGRDKFHHGLEIFDQNVSKSGLWPSGYPELEDMDASMVSDNIQYF